MRASTPRQRLGPARAGEPRRRRGLVTSGAAHLPAARTRRAAAGRRQPRLTVHNKHYDPDAAPPGKSALTVFLESEYGFWKPLEADRPAYEAEKRRCADLVIDAIGRHRPGFAEHGRGRRRLHAAHARALHRQLARRDAGVPPGRRHGQVAPAGRPALRRAPASPASTQAGQWVESWGGITTAAQSGRNAVRALCKKDGARFAY